MRLIFQLINEFDVLTFHVRIILSNFLIIWLMIRKIYENIEVAVIFWISREYSDL
jgi:hypothetical protein